MRIIIGTGTDVASVGVGDPALLAALSECKGRAFEKLRADAVASGALWLAETGADGAYLFHLYVDEEPPSELAPYLKDPITVDSFRVASGKLRVAGEECFVGAVSLADHPHMGRDVDVAPGVYTLTAFWSEAADKLLEGRFAERATPAQRRAWRLGNNLVPICVFATVAALFLGCLIFVRTASVSLALLPLAIAITSWVGRRRYCRGSTYVEAEALFRAIEYELPSIAVVLRMRASGHVTPMAYPGVKVSADRPERVAAVQRQATYVSRGQEYPRIRYGDDDPSGGTAPCPDCGVAKGEFHLQDCEAEHCPVCGHGVIHSCACLIDGLREDLVDPSRPLVERLMERASIWALVGVIGLCAGAIIWALATGAR